MPLPNVRKASTARLLCGVASLATFAGCSSGSDTDAASGRARGDLVPVTAALAVRKDVPVQIRVIGRVEASSTVSIKSQIEGQLAQLHFREGDEVKKGDLLFTIDPRPFEATLQQVEANLERDRAEADNAKVDAERLGSLLTQQLVAKSEHDQAQAKAASLKAAVAADQAAVENVKLQLQYCYIRSPITGRIGRILVHEGNVVKSNDTTLAVINQMRPVHVTFSAPEKDLGEIRKRAAAGSLAVEVTSGDHAPPVTGTLSFIDNAVDTTTGTVLLKGLFPNEDEALWPGQFLDVALTLSVQHDAVVVPSEAIQAGQKGPYVFIVAADQSVDIRPVVPGLTFGPETVVEQGLEPGEQVVTDGQLRLAPGLKVQIKTS